ncbi:hypothetical protein ACFQL1_14620 [Halomicroarcula sp. GCM10025709]|uniref:hypothetical protein n=1 Tax=Haloarcula TaxID=2237 RepID=UPI0024C29670|nr:hypothetical protein [Halomicroarcula sp. YJ-61-S]
MAPTDGVRAFLQRIAPATSGRLSDAGFLLAGATAGALGWGGTQLVAWSAVPLAPVVATAWWVVLIAGFGLLTVFHGPASVRFSDAMFVWGSANGTAMLATVAGVASVLPPRLAFWHAWAVAFGVGYLGTGTLLFRAGFRERGVGYLSSALVAWSVVLVGVRSFATVEPVAFVLLGVLHVVPLVVDATVEWSGESRAIPVIGAVAVVLVVGMVS